MRDCDREWKEGVIWFSSELKQAEKASYGLSGIEIDDNAVCRREFIARIVSDCLPKNNSFMISVNACRVRANILNETRCAFFVVGHVASDHFGQHKKKKPLTLF